MFNDAVILAGGTGNRMLPLTEYVPKPLIRVNDVPLIHYGINFLRSNNIDNIHVTYGYKGEMVASEVYGKVQSLINTTGKDNAYFLFHSNIRWIDAPVVVCPCDMIVQLDLSEVYREYRSLNSPMACIIPVKTELDADGILSKDGTITAMSRGVESDWHASGIQILNPYRINKEIPAFDNFYNVWNALIQKKLLYVTETTPYDWKIFDRIKDLP